MKCIIDCDPGVDDVLAILLALTSPETRVLAYIPQFGNTSLDNAYNNILKIYGVLDRHSKEDKEDVKRFPAFINNANASASANANADDCSTSDKLPLLIRGAQGPIAGPSHSAAYFHGEDGLGNITHHHGDEIPLPTKESLSHLLRFADENISGVDHLLDLLRQQEQDHSITYIALGPLTNLALALRKDAKLVKQKIGLVSIMGGNLDVPGNTSPVAEFNVWADAHAAHEVFEHSVALPIYLLPLDITTDHALPWSEYHSRVDDTLHHSQADAAANAKAVNSEDNNVKPHLPNFTTSFLRHTRQIMETFGKDCMELHDPTAVWFAMQNKPGRPLAKGWSTEKRQFVIEREGEFTRGMCVVDRRASQKIGKGKQFGKSMAELKAARENEPAPVQVDQPEQATVEHAIGNGDAGEKGVNVVVGTPGSEALVEQMLKDIWGA